MDKSTSQDSGAVKVAVMGATGTGKSTFINLLTNDNKIHIGHNPESETSDIQTAHYVDQETGRSVMLIDTPGFDDSREGVTDTDILEKIVRFLEPESGDGQKLNGIIYMHRISDPRVGGVARKNLRMFQALCGEKSLRNVRVVTTFWSSVSEPEGVQRQHALERGAFKALLDAGAQMRRHTNTIETARQIMSELIPLPAVTTQIQEELQAGEKLEDTAAGTVLTAQIRELQKKHAEELANLKTEMEDAWKARDHALRAELEEERKALEEKMAIAEEDRKRLGRTLDEARADLAAEQRAIAELRKETEEKSEALKVLHVKAQQETKRLQEEMVAAEKRRQQEMEAATKRHQEALKAAQDRHEQAMKAAELRRLQEEKNAAEAQRAMKAAQERHEREMKAAELRRAQEAAREAERRHREAMRAAELQRIQEEKARRLELERIEREAQERERQLQRSAEEARQRQAQLQQQISATEREKKQIQTYADRGVFGRFFSDMGSVVEDCANEGEGAAGFLGGLVGGMLGVAVSPMVALKRSIFGK